MCAIAYGPTPAIRSKRSATSSIGQRRVAQRLEVKPARGYVVGDRTQVRPAVAGAGYIPEERFAGLRDRRRARERAALAGARRGRAPSSPTSALTIRTVADHAQLVVQIVLTRSSNTVGLRIIRPAPATTQASAGSAAATR